MWRALRRRTAGKGSQQRHSAAASPSPASAVDVGFVHECLSRAGQVEATACLETGKFATWPLPRPPHGHYVHPQCFESGEKEIKALAAPVSGTAYRRLWRGGCFADGGSGERR